MESDYETNRARLLGAQNLTVAAPAPSEEDVPTAGHGPKEGRVGGGRGEGGRGDDRGSRSGEEDKRRGKREYVRVQALET